mmetsp:Transcript_80166/g.248810  ORF Transcript_80166/g.248810 Transcript_80166/m.248810 type:complete len:468 (+) Transcript_80166:77-1480(+)
MGAWPSAPCLALLWAGACLAERGGLDLDSGSGSECPHPHRPRRRAVSAPSRASGAEARGGLLQLDSEAGGGGGGPCAPGGSTWAAATAGGHSCGTRIGWLEAREGLAPDAARRKVASDFPQECGACSTAPRFQGPGRALLQTCDAPKIGLGLHLGLMRNRLDPETAAKKYVELGVTSVRMWDYDEDCLQALLDAGIKDVLVDVPQNKLGELAADSGLAQQIAGILKPFHDKDMSLRVGIGNEPLAKWEHNGGEHVQAGMENMIKELEAQEMTDVTVTVPLQAGVLGSTYPPDQGRFADQHKDAISAMAKIIHENGGEFTVQLYPWFTRKGNPHDISLDLALGRKKNTIGSTEYSGLLHQMVAATRAALIELDSAYETIPLTVGETGWPSKSDSADATDENLCEYAKHVVDAADGLDPHVRTVYLFEGFDEMNKAGAGSGGGHREEENHFGLMTEDGTLKCSDIKFSR